VLPRIKAEAAPKETATIWANITMSMDPKTGRRKSLDPKTSKQVITIMVRRPMTPTASIQVMKLRFTFSTADKKFPFSSVIDLSVL
jgi:hypothetical protein